MTVLIGGIPYYRNLLECLLFLEAEGYRGIRYRDFGGFRDIRDLIAREEGRPDFPCRIETNFIVGTQGSVWYVFRR